MERRKSTVVMVGRVPIGGANPVVVQSMTDTVTADLDATLAQTIELAEAGSEIVRVTVNDTAAAQAVPPLRARLDDAGWEGLPLVGDFHFIGHRLLSDNPACVRALDKLRINPGNIGRGQRRDSNFSRFIEIARDQGKAVRIGVNAGSLDREMLAARMDANALLDKPLGATEIECQALIESAVASSEQAQQLGLDSDRLIVSCKVSNVVQMVYCYRAIARQTELPLHLGLTEAGLGQKGTIATATALSILLSEGIGDTIRASLTPAVGASRIHEVKICQAVLQVLGIRDFKPQVTACPGCGRTTSERFRRLASNIEKYIDSSYARWRKNSPGSESLKVAVMGCVVNGPGESRNADIGISLPGSGEEPRAPVYVDGRKVTVLVGEQLAEQFIDILEKYVSTRWGARAGSYQA